MNEALSPEIESPFPRNELRVADGPEAVGEQFFSDAVPGRLTVGGIANGNVGIAGLQIDNTVSPDDFKRRVAMLSAPSRQAWHEPPARKCIRRRHAEGLFVTIAPDRRDRSGEGLKPIADDR